MPIGAVEVIARIRSNDARSTSSSVNLRTLRRPSMSPSSALAVAQVSRGGSGTRSSGDRLRPRTWIAPLGQTVMQCPQAKQPMNVRRPGLTAPSAMTRVSVEQTASHCPQPVQRAESISGTADSLNSYVMGNSARRR